MESDEQPKIAWFSSLVNVANLYVLRMVSDSLKYMKRNIKKDVYVKVVQQTGL